MTDALTNLVSLALWVIFAIAVTLVLFVVVGLLMDLVPREEQQGTEGGPTPRRLSRTTQWILSLKRPPESGGPSRTQGPK